MSRRKPPHIGVGTVTRVAQVSDSTDIICEREREGGGVRERGSLVNTSSVQAMFELLQIEQQWEMSMYTHTQDISL